MAFTQVIIDSIGINCTCKTPILFKFVVFDENKFSLGIFPLLHTRRIGTQYKFQ